MYMMERGLWTTGNDLCCFHYLDGILGDGHDLCCFHYVDRVMENEGLTTLFTSFSKKKKEVNSVVGFQKTFLLHVVEYSTVETGHATVTLCESCVYYDKL